MLRECRLKKILNTLIAITFPLLLLLGIELWLSHIVKARDMRGFELSEQLPVITPTIIPAVGREPNITFTQEYVANHPINFAQKYPLISPLVQPTTIYTTFVTGDVLTLTVYLGNKVALLVPQGSYDSTIMNALVNALDGAYNYYATTTDKEPYLYYEYDGRGTIAVVPQTCGGGCGFLGFTGIELTNETWNVLYTGVLNNNQYDQAVFYEFGRNFWHYGQQLEYHNPDNPAAIVTGFAVYMRFKSMEAIGVQGGPVNGGVPYEEHEANEVDMLPLYLADSSLNWNNTLRIDQGFPNPYGLGAADLFASMNMDLEAQHGFTYTQNVWKRAGEQAVANNTQEAVDNFIIAASCAVRKPLTNTFSSWRWPISTAVLQATSNLTQTCGLSQNDIFVFLPLILK